MVGRFDGITQDVMTGRATVRFEIEAPAKAAKEMGPFAGHRLRIEVKRYREKRSLDANAYYWTLVTKLADALGISNPCMHNQLLRRYGQLEDIDGKLIYLVLPDTEEAEDKDLEAETYHIKPTSEVKIGEKGEAYRTYVMMRGSSTYDTKEMSRLIEGLVSECREAGIETITPDEIERMMTAYEKKHPSDG